MPNIFIPKESAKNETRVAATPETVKRMIKAGFRVTIEAGAGYRANIPDKMYLEAGAEVNSGNENLWTEADIILKVAAPTENEAKLVKSESIIIGFLAPYKNHEMVSTFAQNYVSSFAMELIPRITRAQSMDALSSQANVAGYKAVLLAAAKLEKYFPQLMTAAGTVRPARVIVMGAGVAGLQAIATARRLGAIVEASDIRPEVKEQIRSLGGKFIEPPQLDNGTASENGYAKEVTKEFLQKQQETVAKRVAEADVVICTALIPGKPAPKLITKEMVESMHPGSIIVDLAVEQGGNCELSQPNQEITAHGVHILGYSNLASTVSNDASILYSKNVMALLNLMIKDGKIDLNMEDEIIKKTLLTHQGEITHEPTASSLKEGIEL